MVEFKKNILLSIHNIDAVAYQFNTKFKFFNLQHLIQILDYMNEEQLKNCSEKINAVEQKLQAVAEALSSMDSETIDLIASYQRREYDLDKLSEDSPELPLSDVLI